MGWGRPPPARGARRRPRSSGFRLGLAPARGALRSPPFMRCRRLGLPPRAGPLPARHRAAFAPRVLVRASGQTTGTRCVPARAATHPRVAGPAPACALPRPALTAAALRPRRGPLGCLLRGASVGNAARRPGLAGRCRCHRAPRRSIPAPAGSGARHSLRGASTTHRSPSSDRTLAGRRGRLISAVSRAPRSSRAPARAACGRTTCRLPPLCRRCAEHRRLALSVLGPRCPRPDALGAEPDPARLAEGRPRQAAERRAQRRRVDPDGRRHHRLVVVDDPPAVGGRSRRPRRVEGVLCSPDGPRGPRPRPSIATARRPHKSAYQFSSLDAASVGALLPPRSPWMSRTPPRRAAPSSRRGPAVSARPCRASTPWPSPATFPDSVFFSGGVPTPAAISVPLPRSVTSGSALGAWRWSTHARPFPVSS